jgi:nucleoside-diphosphate-sugar epimerase
VAVVGGAGYVGSALVPRLLARGERVRVVDRMLFGRDALQSVLGHPHLELVETDCASDDLERGLEGCDALVHLAAIVGDPACDADPELATRVNVDATRRLVDAARRVGVRRLVFASSCAVYRACRALVDERSAAEPCTLYAHTKLAGEHIVLREAAFAAPVVLRLASLYGLSGRSRFDLVVNRFAAQACTRGRIAVRGGSQHRPFLHVEDAAHAIEAVLDADPDTLGQRPLNAGSENLAIARVAQLVARAVPGTRVEVEPEEPGGHDYRVRFSELARCTAFAPRWTVRGGILQVIRALRSGEVVRPDEVCHDNASMLRERLGCARAPAVAAP